MGSLRCIVARTAVYSAPKRSAELETELIYGQLFCPERTIDGFVEGKLMPLIAQKSGPVSKGFVREKDLASEVQPASHKIIALQAPIFSRTHIKSQIKGRLPLGGRISPLTSSCANRRFCG